MAFNFQKIVLTVAIVIFIILMIFVATALYENKYKVGFPPVISECPDYWVDQQKQPDPNELADNQTIGAKCVNVKNLGNDACQKEMSFVGDFWTGKQGNCNKYIWAKSCDLTWDVITNNPDICKSS